MDRWCAEIDRDPSEIERSAGARPSALGQADALVDAGATLITLGIDGTSNFDMGPVPEWLAWRDDRNAASTG